LTFIPHLFSSGKSKLRGIASIFKVKGQSPVRSHRYRTDIFHIFASLLLPASTTLVTFKKGSHAMVFSSPSPIESARFREIFVSLPAEKYSSVVVLSRRIALSKPSLKTPDSTTSGCPALSTDVNILTLSEVAAPKFMVDGEEGSIACPPSFLKSASDDVAAKTRVHRKSVSVVVVIARFLRPAVPLKYADMRVVELSRCRFRSSYTNFLYDNDDYHYLLLTHNCNYKERRETEQVGTVDCVRGEVIGCCVVGAPCQWAVMRRLRWCTHSCCSLLLLGYYGSRRGDDLLRLSMLFRSLSLSLMLIPGFLSDDGGWLLTGTLSLFYIDPGISSIINISL